MNKMYLVAGGACIASLAAGAVGGYFFAQNKLGKEFDDRLDRELAETEKRFSVQLMEARSGKPDSPTEIIKQRVETDSEEEEVEELENPVLEQNATKALVDYQGISNSKIKPLDNGTVESNIFANKPKRKRMPRGENGKFLKRTPVLIDAEVFITNDEGFDEVMLRWYSNDKTLLSFADEEEDVDKVGQDNLKALERIPEDKEKVIFVRNEGLRTLYQISQMDGSLTEEMGFADGELDGSEDLDELENYED